MHGERRKETSTNDQNKDNNDTHVQNVNDDIEDEDEDEILTSNDMNYNANRNKRGTETTKDDFTILNPKQTEMNDDPLNDDDVMFVHTKKQLQKRKYSKPDKDGKYKKDNFISRVKITRIMELGQATPTKTFERKDRKKVFHKVYDNERHDILAKALRFANQHIFQGGIDVKSVEKEDDTLQVAKEFTAPTNKYFVKGWARRNTNK